MSEERLEEERRYEEAAKEEAKRLDSRVLSDPVPVLEPKSAVIAAPGDKVIHVARAMADKRCSCALVVEDNRLIGIFTERDALARVLIAGRDPHATVVDDVMTPDPERLVLGDTIGYALHKMTVGSFRNLPLVDRNGVPAGVVSQQDGVKYLVGFFPDEIINQPPRSIVQNPPPQYGG